uniref:ubiquitinyl hydrolase 1 n=1 Tax=Culicoides sonorensis TaxID=179676 RepID=A0A336MFB2_CULSO
MPQQMNSCLSLIKHNTGNWMSQISTICVTAQNEFHIFEIVFVNFLICKSHYNAFACRPKPEGSWTMIIFRIKRFAWLIVAVDGDKNGPYLLTIFGGTPFSSVTLNRFMYPSSVPTTIISSSVVVPIHNAVLPVTRMTLDNGYSPQADTLDFLSRYVSCENNLALVVPANQVKPLPKDRQPTDNNILKRGVNGLTCGAYEIVKSLDRHITSKLTSKKQNDKRSSPQPTSSFYIVPEVNIVKANSSEELHHISNITMDPSGGSAPKPTKKVSISKSTPNLDKQDSGSSSTGSSVGYKSVHLTNHLTDNEEYLRYVENHERNLERKKKNKSKAATIMSLEDRDLIIIDKADIKEASKSASDVIIVDPPPTLNSSTENLTQSELDLKDILGENWPTAAGDLAPLLNKEKKPMPKIISGAASSSSSSTASSSYLRERNKSANPISHLISSTKISSNKDHLEINGHKRSNSTHLEHLIPAPVNQDSEPFIPTPINEIPGTNLGVGSMVEVSTDISENLYGVIRWIGSTSQAGTTNRVIVGVELEEEQTDRPLMLTDGTYNGLRLFRCPPGRALFVHPAQCSKDRRFTEPDTNTMSSNTGGKVVRASQIVDGKKLFGQVDCPIVEGSVPPLKIIKPEDLDALCGKFKGIQGHHNSCYLDATLFSMFTFTSVFDSLLFRPKEPEDNNNYEEVQKVLREEIVNPLRKNMFVRADRVLKFRHLLDKSSSVTGLTNEEKDPEEFLNCLLSQILRAEPFLKLSSGLDAFYYQLFVEKDERLSLPSVQQLFEQSFLQSDIKLKEVPSCLIIQMPRFAPRQCTVCGKLAEYECRECFGMLQCGVGLESTAFCKKCLETAHSHSKRTNHIAKPLSVPHDFKIMSEHCPVPRLFMELFAVVCIETSHYVAFVKAGSGSGQDAPWCFFDSMADRKGEQNGYNIPEMVSVPDLPQWLSEEGARNLHELAPSDKMLPEHAKRLMCDAYMCMYQSTDIMMYR